MALLLRQGGAVMRYAIGILLLPLVALLAWRELVEEARRG